MAISATHDTLLYLGENDRPTVPPGRHLRNAPNLGCRVCVIKFEPQRVGLAAVYTGMFT